MTTSAESAERAGTNRGGRWTVAICALGGLGLALAFFATRTPVYEAEALVAVSNPSGPIGDEVAVVLSPAVLDVAETLIGSRPEVTVTAAEVASLLTVSATSDTAEDAAAAANAVAATYIQAQVGAAANMARSADVPTSRSGLGALVYAALGSVIGAAVGLAASGLQSAGRRPTARREPRPQLKVLAPPRHAPSLVPSATTPTGAQHPDPFLPDPRTAQQTVGHLRQTPPDRHAISTNSRINVPMNSGSSFFTQTAVGDQAPKPPEPPADVTSAEDRQEPVDATPASDDPVVDASDEPTKPVPPTDTPFIDDRQEPDELAPATPQPQTSFEVGADRPHEEVVVAFYKEVAKLTARHERESAELQAEITALNREVRKQSVRLKGRDRDDQTRAGDLEAQVDALEVELAELRQTLEAERIAHTRRITEEQAGADRTLDNARREYRTELNKHVHNHRQALADYRNDLDAELTETRALHAEALEQQHLDYERQHEAERSRAEEQLTGSRERHERELDVLRAGHQQELEQKAEQYKEAVAGLRVAGASVDSHIEELEQTNRKLRVEIATLQKHDRDSLAERRTIDQHRDGEIASLRSELDGERQRNSALRADVLRRSAEAHQAIDRAVEERTAQLAELEASVARQREYADRRVREAAAVSAEQAREAASREASLTATVSRLKRELEEARRQ